MAYKGNKMKSRRWWIVLWAISTATILMGYSIITKYSPDWLGIVLPIILAIPSVYIGFDTTLKNTYAKKPEEQ